MSELMIPIPFRELMTWVTTEYQRDGSVFGVHKPYKAGVKKLPIFGETIETPFGPAAGPNTQLAQNIIAEDRQLLHARLVGLVDAENGAVTLVFGGDPGHQFPEGNGDHQFRHIRFPPQILQSRSILAVVQFAPQLLGSFQNVGVDGFLVDVHQLTVLH